MTFFWFNKDNYIMQKLKKWLPDNETFNHLLKYIDALPFYALIVDEEHIILAVNEATTKATGLSVSELLNKYCPHAIHGCEHAYEGCPLEEAVKTNATDMVKTITYTDGVPYNSYIFPTNYVSKKDKKLYLHFTIEKSLDSSLDALLELIDNIHIIMGDRV